MRDLDLDPDRCGLAGSARDFRGADGPDLLARGDAFSAWAAQRRRHGHWPYSRATESGPGTVCTARDDAGHPISGVNLASQDYLSLAAHPEIVASAREAAGRFGVHSAGSPVLAGHTAASIALEHHIAAFVGMEHALLYPTGWAAGYGAIRGLVRGGDHVLLDALSHTCLQEGAGAATRNVALFRHNDLDHARDRLAAIRARDARAGILVVTEGLFSMDSDTPDLGALQALCHAYGATLLVDVAHDLGSLGRDGRGHLGIQSMLGRVDLVMGSFSKTFASNGGFVATNRAAIKEYLRYYSPSATFSNALSPVQTAVIARALSIVESGEGRARRARLMDNVLLLRGLLREAGLPVYGAPSAIVCARVGGEALARMASRRLAPLGLLANLVEYPAVPRGTARFRMQVMADHTEADLRTAVAVLAQGVAEARILAAVRAARGDRLAA